MPRPRTDARLVARALALVDTGLTARVASEQLAGAGVNVNMATIYRALKERAGRKRRRDHEPGVPVAPVKHPKATKVPKSADPFASVLAGAAAPAKAPPVPAVAQRSAAARRGLDPKASPLELVRGLIADIAADLDAMPQDSPRSNPARAALLQAVRRLQDIEREQATVETPAQALARLRLADAETRRKIEVYTLQHEAEAARLGVCVHCRQPWKGAA